MHRAILNNVIILILLSQVSCGQTTGKKIIEMSNAHRYTNKLINENSPYLLQHAHNPVNWYPWGEEALAKAKKENKMIIISIGYAACHWCHVMERETYEDSAVAKMMNEHFISIKVDREERPDVDQVYMNAAQLISGNGGWPLNALAMPDGKPFYAGTYFPKKNWMQMLQYFIDQYQQNPVALKEQSENVTKGIHNMEKVPFSQNIASFTINDLNAIFEKAKTTIDFKKGGGKSAPKFPMPAMWEYLLYYHYLSGNGDAMDAVKSTLNNMASGGIYDQVGGGFARYSTDENWHVPHFEKMLYDNAQLASLYTHAYQVTKNPLYKNVVFETLDFIQREMTSPEGGFYSSLDADSDGEEGKFYVWTKEQIENALGNEANLFIDYYNVTKAGNWEHEKNILFKNEPGKKLAAKYKLTNEQLEEKLTLAKIKLLQLRSKRIRPSLDNKILTSWNALMLKAYTQAYRVFGEERFLKMAITNALFLQTNAIGKRNELTHNYKNGKSTINAFLDDYAFTISAFIELYQATFNEEYLIKANELLNYVQVHFFDKSSGMFFYTSDIHSKLIARKMEVSDNVIPSSNSEMAKNLYYLGHYFYKEENIKIATQMLSFVKKDVQQNIRFYANWGLLEATMAGGLYEVAIVGNEFESKRKELDNNFLPNIILSATNKNSNLPLLEGKLVEGQTTIYVCQDKVCKRPVTEIKMAIPQILPLK